MAYELSAFKGISSIFGGVLVHITLGTFYTLGNVNTYLTSYLRKYVDPTAVYADSIWINAMFMFSHGSLMILGGILERKIGARLSVLLGSIIFSGSIALTYYTVRRGFLYVVFTYGFCSGCGVGLAYVGPLAVGMKWFPKKKGLVNGLIVGGYGLGALIFNQVQTTYLNPLNSPPGRDGYFTDDAILLKVPSLFVLLGSIYFIVQLVGSLLICEPPIQPDEIIFSDGRLLLINSADASEPGYSSCEDSSTGMDLPEPPPRRDMTPYEAFRTGEFVKMWLMFALSTQGVQFVNTMYKAFGQRFIHDDHFLTFVGSIASAFNAVGRIIWGLMLDRTSFRSTFLTLSSTFCLLMFTFISTEYSSNRFHYFVWVCAIFFTFSGLFVVFPTATAIVFGRTYAGTIYGMLFTAPALASLLGALFFQTVQKELDWFGSFFFVTIITFLGMIVMAYFPSETQHKTR